MLRKQVSKVFDPSLLLVLSVAVPLCDWLHQYSLNEMGGASLLDEAAQKGISEAPPAPSVFTLIIDYQLWACWLGCLSEAVHMSNVGVAQIKKSVLESQDCQTSFYLIC